MEGRGVKEARRRAALAQSLRYLNAPTELDPGREFPEPFTCVDGGRAKKHRVIILEGHEPFDRQRVPPSVLVGGSPSVGHRVISGPESPVGDRPCVPFCVRKRTSPKL